MYWEHASTVPCPVFSYSLGAEEASWHSGTRKCPANFGQTGVSYGQSPKSPSSDWLETLKDFNEPSAENSVVTFCRIRKARVCTIRLFHVLVTTGIFSLLISLMDSLSTFFSVTVVQQCGRCSDRWGSPRYSKLNDNDAVVIVEKSTKEIVLVLAF